jgi:hypothetical protein
MDGSCWFVGAMTNRGDDQTDRFIDEGIWEHDFDDNSRVLAQVRSMQTGERIAIKAAYIKKHGLDIETGGNTLAVIDGHKVFPKTPAPRVALHRYPRFVENDE